MNTSEAAEKPILPADWLAILALVALSVAATVAYLSTERALFWSDYWQHFHVWQQSVELFKAAPGTWLLWLISSDAELSAYYTVANLPAGLLFGTSRMTFILSLVLVYAWPYLILSSLLVARIFRQSSRKTFWIALSIIGINPLFWAIPWKGYPDYAAACVVTCAWLLYMKDPRLQRSNQAAKLGLLFGLAPLLRRHFAYTVASSYLSMFIHSLLLEKQTPWKEFVKSAEFRRVLLRYLFIVLYAGAFAAIMAFNYLNQVINFNYDLVFLAFHLPFSICAKYYLSSFGAVILLMSAAGWYLAIKRQLLTDHNARLFLIYGCITTIVWFTKVEMVGLHYTSHFMLVITIGVVALVVQVLRLMEQTPATSAKFQAAAAAIYLFLMVNLAQGVGVPIPGVPQPTIWEVYLKERPGNPLGYLFSTRNAPIVRQDLPEIKKLCEFLMQQCGPKARLSVASSSSVFNDELLFDAFNQLIPDERRANMPQFIKLPQIDYRDDSPIHNLAQCDCIIVAEPFQTHLLPERQNLLLFTVDSFRQHIGLAKDFAPVGPKFHLDEGVELTVYHRVAQPTIAGLFDSVQFFQPYDRSPHLMRNPWLAWKGWRDVDITFLAKARKHIPIFKLKASGEPSQLELIYLGPVNYRLAVNGHMMGLGSGQSEVRISEITPAGELWTQTPIVLKGESTAFSGSVPPHPTALLQITVQTSGIDPKNPPSLKLSEPTVVR